MAIMSADERYKQLRYPHKMTASPTSAAALQTIIDDSLKKGYCIDVTDQPPQSPIWYLPVFQGRHVSCGTLLLKLGEDR